MKSRIPCPICPGTVKLRTEARELTYKDCIYKVIAWFYKCTECQEEFTTNECDERTLRQVYAQHKTKQK